MEIKNSTIKQSQTIFGDIIYWLTIVAAIFCMVGPVMAFWAMDSNALNPHHLFADMWAGMDPAAIWAQVGGVNGGGNHWVYNMFAGDGIVQLGLIIGCSVAMPAMLAAAFLYVFKEKSVGWAMGALWITILIAVSVLGIVNIS